MSGIFFDAAANTASHITREIAKKFNVSRVAVIATASIVGALAFG